jgi:cell division protein FtsI (penicillin-binding protein 3)
MIMASMQEPQTNQSRLTVLGLCLTFGLAVLLAQLFRYQVMLHSELVEFAESQRVKQIVIPPERGNIWDANGYLLATNIHYWEIAASPELVTDPVGLADQLAQILSVDRDELYAKLSSNAGWVRLANYVPQPLGEIVDGLNGSGLMCTPHFQRTYPMDDLAGHVIGIVNSTGNGFYGVEGSQNKPLRGITGTLEIETGPDGRELPIPPRVMRSPQRGQDIALTLDLHIQHIVLQELARALDKYGAQQGSVIVMDPRSGALLAVASLPGYNPNQYATTEPKLLADPVVSRMWEPGSVLKIVTWAAGLDAGVITPYLTVHDAGQIEVGGRVIENADRMAHGNVTMTRALVESLNTVAAHISTTLGKELFYNYLRRFGFGDLTGVDLASEGPGMMKYPGASNWYPSELATNAFGQGIAVTPIQMITACAAVANGGVLMKPHIVEKLITVDEHGTEQDVIEIKPTVVRQAISREAAEDLTEMLVRAVDGKAAQARVPGYRVAGKTGTAQIPTPFGYDRKDTIVSFVGYLPADDPQLIILVKLDRPKTSRWAYRTAAPVFGAIAERLVAYRQIPPDDIRLARQ